MRTVPLVFDRAVAALVSAILDALEWALTGPGMWVLDALLNLTDRPIGYAV